MPPLANDSSWTNPGPSLDLPHFLPGNERRRVRLLPFAYCLAPHATAVLAAADHYRLHYPTRVSCIRAIDSARNSSQSVPAHNNARSVCTHTNATRTRTRTRTHCLVPCIGVKRLALWWREEILYSAPQTYSNIASALPIAPLNIPSLVEC